MYIDKHKVIRCCQFALLINLIVLGADIITLIKNRSVYLLEGSTPVASELISLFLVGILYYLATIYDQPTLSFNTNKTKSKSKKRSRPDIDVVLDEEELITDDYLEDIESDDPLEQTISNSKLRNNSVKSSGVKSKVISTEQIEKDIPKDKPKLVIDTSNIKPKEGKVDVGEIQLKINSALLGNVDTEKLPEDDIQLNEVCDNAEKEDTFNINTVPAIKSEMQPPNLDAFDRTSLDLSKLHAFADFSAERV